jgi:hypothetical protein
MTSHVILRNRPNLSPSSTHLVPKDFVARYDKLDRDSVDQFTHKQGSKICHIFLNGQVLHQGQDARCVELVGRQAGVSLQSTANGPSVSNVACWAGSFFISSLYIVFRAWDFTVHQVRWQKTRALKPSRPRYATACQCLSGFEVLNVLRRLLGFTRSSRAPHRKLMAARVAESVTRFSRKRHIVRRRIALTLVSDGKVIVEDLSYEKRNEIVFLQRSRQV